MFIKRLRVKNWRALRDFSLDFDEGVNLICGPNESGKSSLAEALMAAFLVGLRPRGKSPASSAKPWTKSGKPTVEVSFVHQAKEWRILKEFFTDRAELECDGRILAQGRKVEKALEEALAGGALSSVMAMQGALELADVPPELRAQVAASETLSPGLGWLEAELKSLYDHYWSPNRGQARKPLTDAREAVIECEGTVRDLEGQLRESDYRSLQLEADDAELVGLRKRIADLEEQETLERQQLENELSKIERELTETEGWMKRWDEVSESALQCLNSSQEFEQQLAGFEKELGEVPTREHIDQLKGRYRVLLSCVNQLVDEELAELNAPCQHDLDSWHTCERELEALDELTRLLGDQAGQGQSDLQGRVEAGRREQKELEAQLEQLDVRLDELAELARRQERLTAELAALDAVARRWDEAVTTVLKRRKEQDDYDSRLEQLKSQVGPPPPRAEVESLKARADYCHVRRQQLLQQELDTLNAPDDADLSQLEQLEARLGEPARKSGSSGVILGGVLGLIIGVLAGLALQLGSAAVAGMAVGGAILGTILGFAIYSGAGKGNSEEQAKKREILERCKAETVNELRERAQKAKLLLRDLSSDELPKLDTLRPQVADHGDLDKRTPEQLKQERDTASARYRTSEAEWTAACQRHEEHRKTYEAALQENPGAALQESLQLLVSVTKEDETPGLKLPNEPEISWFEGLKDCEWAVGLKARRESLTKELSACAKVLEEGSALKHKRLELRSQLKAKVEDIESASSALDSRRGSEKKTRELVGQATQSHPLLKEHLFPLLTGETDWPFFRRRLGELRERVEERRRAVLDAFGADDGTELESRAQKAKELEAMRIESPPTQAEIADLIGQLPEDPKPDLTEVMRQLKSLPGKIEADEAAWLAHKQAYDQKARERAELASQDPSKLLKHNVEQLQQLCSQQPGLELPDDLLGSLGLEVTIEPVRQRLESLRARAGELRAVRDNRTEVEHPLRRVRARIAESRESSDEVKRRIQQAQGTQEREQDLYSRLVQAREKLARAQSEQREVELTAQSLQMLHSALEEAKAEVEGDLVGPLRDRIDARLRRLTEGRYSGLQMEVDFRADSVLTAEQKPANLSDLSYGTKEQLAFLSRLCLAELLAQEERSLVVFDDNLVHTDAARLATACEFLNEVSQGVQVLLFTCHPERFVPFLPEAKRNELVPLSVV